MKKFIVLIFIIILANSVTAAEIGLDGVEKNKIKIRFEFFIEWKS